MIYIHDFTTGMLLSLRMIQIPPWFQSLTTGVSISGWTRYYFACDNADAVPEMQQMDRDFAATIQDVFDEVSAECGCNNRGCLTKPMANLNPSESQSRP